MLFKDCEVGQRVLCVGPVDSERKLIGYSGTIIDVIYGKSNPIVVEFDDGTPEHYGLWDCTGKVPSGRGRYGRPGAFELIEDPLPDTFEISIFDMLAKLS